ncbi:MAG: hypothetical protein IJK97_10935, partial [Thermoguttaceae bacterium]|nr:hypothetical protein [Thermoguttaceae bacterium]
MTNHFIFTRVFTALLLLCGVIAPALADENEAAPKDELPIVDISGDAWRQTVIAEGTPDVYQG